MKVFLTIEFFALLVLVIAWWRDVYHRSDYRSNDGGWTTTYSYSRKIRIQAYNASYCSLCIAIIGILFLIWK